MDQTQDQKAPQRSPAQRIAALEKANRVRTRRAQLKKDLKAGRESIHEILLDPPEWVKTMKLFDLMMACPKYGKVKVNKLLQQGRVSHSKTVGGLSLRQRTEIVFLVKQ